MGVSKTDRYTPVVIPMNITQYMVTRVTLWPANADYQSWSRSMAKKLSINVGKLENMAIDGDGDLAPDGTYSYVCGWRFSTYPFHENDPDFDSEDNTGGWVYGSSTDYGDGDMNLGQLQQWVRNHDDLIRAQFESVMDTMAVRRDAGLNPWIEAQ